MLAVVLLLRRLVGVGILVGVRLALQPVQVVAPDLEILVERYRLAIGLQGFAAPALPLVGDAAAVEGDVAERIELDRLGIVGQSADEIVLAEPRVAALLVSLRVGPQPDRMAEILDRAIPVLLVVVRPPTLEVGERVARIELDSLVEVLDGEIVLTQGNPGDAAIGEEDRLARVDPDRLLEIGQRLRRVVLRVMGDGPVAVGLGEVAAAADQSGAAADAAVMIVALPAIGEIGFVRGVGSGLERSLPLARLGGNPGIAVGREEVVDRRDIRRRLQDCPLLGGAFLAQPSLPERRQSGARLGRLRAITVPVDEAFERGLDVCRPDPVPLGLRLGKPFPLLQLGKPSPRVGSDLRVAVSL